MFFYFEIVFFSKKRFIALRADVSKEMIVMAASFVRANDARFLQLNLSFLEIFILFKLFALGAFTDLTRSEPLHVIELAYLASPLVVSRMMREARHLIIILSLIKESSLIIPAIAESRYKELDHFCLNLFSILFLIAYLSFSSSTGVLIWVCSYSESTPDTSPSESSYRSLSSGTLTPF